MAKGQLIVDTLLQEEGNLERTERELKDFLVQHPRKKVYYSIIFFSEAHAQEPLRVLDEEGEEAAIDYCAQWDYGRENEHTPIEERPWGTSDRVYIKPLDGGTEYILSYNPHFSYIGLTRSAFVTE